MQLWRQFDGYKTYLGAALIALHATGQIIGVFNPGVGNSGFDAGQDSLQMMFANFELLFAVVVVFIRMGQKSSERKIISAMRGDDDEG